MQETLQIEKQVSFKKTDAPYIIQFTSLARRGGLDMMQ